METETQEYGRQLALQWVVSNAFGWAIGMGLAAMLGSGLGDEKYSPLVVGAVVGLRQWRVLPKRLRNLIWWIPVSILSWYVAIRVGTAKGILLPDPLWAGGLGGLAAGLLQMLILWGQVSRAWLWLAGSAAASIIGWLLGTYAGVFFFDRLTQEEIYCYIIGGLVCGVVFGALTAPILIWMLRHPAANAPQKAG